MTLLVADEVAAITRLSKSELYRRAREGKAPKALRLAPRRVVWDSAELEAWIEQQKAAS